MQKKKTKRKKFKSVAKEILTQFNIEIRTVGIEEIAKDITEENSPKLYKSHRYFGGKSGFQGKKSTKDNSKKTPSGKLFVLKDSSNILTKTFCCPKKK